jgi:uncharacterized protein (TIGR03118 family)
MTSFRAAASVVVGGILALILAACGGGGTDTPSPAASRYAATILIADTAVASGAARTDAKLVNPWDLAFSGQAAVWVTNNGSSSSTFHDIADAARQLLIGSPSGSTASARPTGVAFNSGNGFEVTQDGRTGVARFIVASEGGTLSGWAPALGLEAAVLAFDGSAAAAVYTGLVKTTMGGSDDILLAADFHNRVVDAFGTDFRKLAGAGRFVDPALPAGYAPFGILAHGELIHVAYAKQDDQAHAPQFGAGLGMVNTFDTAGRLMKRLIPVGDSLNAPWGMAIAPAAFGALSGALLVANTGDGAIHAFDPASGRSLGALTGPDGAVLAIDGLHRIAFGNGAAGLPTNALFFAAGPDGGRHGVFGRIDLQ